MSRTLPRVLAGLGAGLALAVAVPLAASAHVTIDPGQAGAGSWTYVTFRVPNESAAAKTVSLDIQLPTDTPFTHVAFQPTAGWTGTVTTEPLPTPVQVHGNTVSDAPTHLVLTADPGAGTAPGQLQTFLVSLGPVPDVGHVVIPVTQTYDDGTVAAWAATPEQVAADDSLKPAPVLWVNDAPPADAHPSDATAAPASDTVAPDANAGIALGLSIAALAIAAGGALLAALALGRRKKAA